MGWTIQASNPGSEKYFCFLQSAQTGAGAHPSSYLAGKKALFSCE
jgi:hypothetical protein